jgi:hypothetical protein
LTNNQGACKINPVMNIGDIIAGKEIYSFQGSTWINLYEILGIEEKNRFGKPAKLLCVKITTSQGKVVDEKTYRWDTQLF